MSEKDKKIDEKIKLLVAVRNNKPVTVACDQKTSPIKKPFHPPPFSSFQTASQDATSIKGKQVDDSAIGDGKALVYSGVKDKIVYKRLGGGGGGAGAGGGDADTLDGIHAAGFLQGTWASGTCTVAKGGGTPHGLGGTPTLVFPSANAPQVYAMGWTADNINIYFWHNAAATLIINWLARL